VTRWIGLAAALVLAAAAGTVGGYWLGERNLLDSWFAALQAPDSDSRQASAPARSAAVEPPKERKVLYYKDPMGNPDTSPVPKKDWMGMDYIPVYEDEEQASASPAPSAAGAAHQHGAATPDSNQSGGASTDRKILYYRNPMGLADTSPVPKKDPMGMDYIPVYADEAEAARTGIVKISPGRVQQIGVRSEPVSRRDLVRPIRAVGIVQFDERRTFVVSTRFEGWIEKLLVNATGETVRRGQPLMQVYSPDLVLAQQEYALLSKSEREKESGTGNAPSRRFLAGAEQRLRYLDFPAAEMERLKREAEPRPVVTIPSPVSGTVIEKPALQGMRFEPGEPLYKIIDMSQVWLIAEVFEQDLGEVRIGQEATITVKAYPARAFEGRVAFIYPTVDEQTRTARVRIEIPNPNGTLKADMYANVEIASPVSRRGALAVPESAVIDNGVRQVVLIDRGEGRFEPREVKLGERGEGYVEVRDGVREGEPVVVSANFLIDAESNLKAALGGFGGEGHQHQ
jgi:membrane fusion protein, copper/silver efflux system